MAKAVMNYTIDDMKAFSHGSVYNILFIFYTVIILSVLGFTLFFVVIALAGGAKLSDMAYSLFLLAAGIGLMTYFLIYRYVVLPKNNLKNIKSRFGDNPVYFNFEENYFKVNAEKGVNSENVSIEYDKLIKAKEVKDYFFLYSDQRHAYVIKKSAFVMGCPEDLSAYLKKHLAKKFIIRL